MGCDVCQVRGCEQIFAATGRAANTLDLTCFFSLFGKPSPASRRQTPCWAQWQRPPCPPWGKSQRSELETAKRRNWRRSDLLLHGGKSIWHCKAQQKANPSARSRFLPTLGRATESCAQEARLLLEQGYGAVNTPNHPSPGCMATDGR